MKSSTSKKPNLKIQLDRKSVASLPKTDKPPSSKCSHKTISSNAKTSASSNKLSFKFQETFSTPNPSIVKSEGEKKTGMQEGLDDQSELIQFLIHENLQLQKQNSDKDDIINKLITSSTKKPPQLLRANTSNTERNNEKPRNSTTRPFLLFDKKPQQITKEKKQSSPLGFTFCNTETGREDRVIQSQPSTKSNRRLPKEFQIVPNQKRLFI